jgi:integrase
MDGTNLPLFEYFMTDCSTPAPAADTTTEVDAFVQPVVQTFEDAVGFVDASLACPPAAITDCSTPAPAADTTTEVDAFVQPVVWTFEDAIRFVGSSMECSTAARTVLKTALRQIAWGVSVVNARDSGQYLDPNRKKLDLARMPFDLPAINRALAGVRYRMAGFNSEKSCRNAKSGLRRIGRELGMVASHRAPELPPDNPYAPLLAAADEFQLASVRRFAARMMQEGRLPGDVTGEDLRRYGTFLATQMVGVRIEPMLRRIVQLWRRTAASHPDWPQTPLQLTGEAKLLFNPPFSAYPVSLQNEIEAIRRWMEGGVGPFDSDARKPLRPATIKLRLACIRLILAHHVSLGCNLQSVTSLGNLLSKKVMQPILQSIWQLGQTRLKAVPDSEREHNREGTTGQTDAAGVTVLILAQYFDLAPDVLKEMQWLAKRMRKQPMKAMSRKNRKRIDQFLDPVKRGLLLNLPGTLMAEAMELRERQPAEAARLARTAIFFAIELRIPLRMKNLHACRLGHNLRFAGAGSPIATLSFQGHEMKNGQEIEFGISRRLCQTLQTYIELFLPWFAATSQDFAAKQWLFPAGDGKAGPLSNSQVRKTIIDTMAERVGAEFHPHLFRGLAVEFSLEHDPDGLEHCRQLLGDKSLQVILTHYAPVRTKRAAERQDELVNAEADRLAILASPVKRRRKTGDRS